ncbi:hypothetical protein FACS1894196_2520 [Clostridia bacterium]|nr:hypothetical protein FACS1894196_2520 [Clostridia bacterium]
MKKSVRLRFVVAIFLMMFSASAVAACFAGVMLNGQIGESFEEGQRDIAEMMRSLAQRTDYTVDEILALCARSPYGAQRVPDRDVTGIRYVRQEVFFKSYTLLELRDATIRIFVARDRPLIAFFVVGILVTAVACVVLGTLLAGLASNRALWPVNALIDAIERIAQGDFSARVTVPTGRGLSRLMRSFNKMADELSGLEASRADFVNNVSHEFRTPLSSIHGFATLLQNPDLPAAERLEYAGIIAEETKRLSSLATDIVSLSRLENQTIVTGQTRYALDEQLRRVLLLLEPAWSKKELDMQVALDAVQYYGNEELLRRVWLNIVGNAIKFTPEGGAVSVSLTDAEDAVVVRVKDTGIGMDAHTIKHLYDRFFQGDDSHTKDGAGLGLSLARRIVDLCGGEITVRSEVGKGSAFRVKLPKGER